MKNKVTTNQVTELTAEIFVSNVQRNMSYC